MIVLRRLLAALAIFALAENAATAFPAGDGFGFDMAEADNSTGPFTDYPAVIKSRQNRVELRILPLGASIMEGVGSSQHSGLRKPLRMALRNDGYQVNMVGSRQHGRDMTDKDHEATSGALIHEARNYLRRSLPYKPNIVIINVGTNNANNNRDVSQAEELMGGIFDAIWNESGMRDTCIILSTLLPTSAREGTINRISINQGYRNLVRNRAGEGKCAYIADMEPPGEGSGFLGLNQPVWAPNENPVIHPNDEGHRRMAYIFYAAIHRALSAGKVKAASPMSITGAPTCDKIAGNGEFAPNTQRGSGQGNGVYAHFSAEQGGPGPIFEVESPWDRNQWRWARLFSRKYDDLLGWYDYSSNDHRFGVWKNSGDGQGRFTRIGEAQGDLRGNIYCIPRGLHFADVDGDGLDDIVCVSPTGDLHMSRNRGDGSRSANRLPTFEYLGMIMTGKAKQDRIRLADIDGDGRVDYGVVRDNGHVEFWRNSGTGKTPGFWQHLGVRSTMPPNVINQLEGIRFEDVNGDGRDDWMWMSASGQTTTYTNARSCAKGREGNGLNVAWRRAYFRGSNSGATHGGVSNYRDDFGEDWEDWRNRIHFARIYGREESFAFRDQSVKDYVFMHVQKGKDKAFNFRVRAWKNLGEGGTKLEADGNKYCNMHGWEDGREDYVWAWSTGELDLYPNAGKKQVSGGESYWSPWVPNFWKPPQNVDRRNIHLADWNGDGACDIIWVDPASNNGVRVWINKYPTTRSWSNAFEELRNVPKLECNDRNGIGIHDIAVRFADISGNNRADYLCIRETGLVRGRIQSNNGGFGPMIQIKFDEGKDRANLRWADVNGDGNDDMIWVDKFNGNGFVWYNDGPHSNPSANSGSSWRWRKINNHVYDGSYAGTCQYFPDLDGNGRADLHSIKGTWTNDAESWYNPGCGLRDATGDDPEGVNDPRLPVQPGNPIGGPGPGEEGGGGGGGEEGSSCGRDSDDRDWRKIDCQHPMIRNHDQFNPAYTLAQVWNGIDAGGAFRSALDYWHCRLGEGRPREHFSNQISDFFHGPSNFHCHIFSTAGGCAGGTSLQCPSTNKPAGYFILNSFRTIWQIQKDWYDAIADITTFGDPEVIAEQFGIASDTGNPSLAILLDVAMMSWSIIMGPYWNKILSQSSRPGLAGGNSGLIKDEVNDLVKNGATLAKDIYALKHKATSDAGTAIKVRAAMVDIANSWREGIESTMKQLFDGSDSSILKLSLLMTDGAMLDSKVLEELNPSELYPELKRVLNAQLIPLTWSVSSAKLYPVIIREEIGCDQSPAIPWTNDGVRYMTSRAFGKRVCNGNTGGHSYWLIAPRDFASCTTNSPDDPNCAAFDLPPGFERLEQNTWRVNVNDVVEGSIATWMSNGRRNGGPIPDINSQSVDVMIEKGLRSPGVFRIPICDMLEARENWYKAYNGATLWANFPCDP